jgi:protocatechuate 3,4-dioxygenase beta subunit
MTRSKRADWLDRIILEARPGSAPKVDFDAWRNAHPGAVKRLRQRGATIPRERPFHASARRIVRNLIRNPISRLAAAAAIIGAVLFLAVPRSQPELPPANLPATAANQAPPRTDVDPEEAELRTAGDLFSQGDVQGLLVLLHTARPRTVFVAVEYLGQIGDLSSLPTLQTFAAQWQGPTQENPFQNAIDQIRRRYGQNETETPKPVQTPVVVVQSPQEGPPTQAERPPLICRGAVVDETGTPVVGAEVLAQSCGEDLSLRDLGTPVGTDSQGRFSVMIPTDKIDRSSRVYLLGRHKRFALGWTRLPLDRGTAEFSDCRIVLYAPTAVAGTITDARGNPIAGAIVKARVVSPHEPNSTQEYPYGTGPEPVVSDGMGRFTLADVPQGSRLSLSASRPGYATHDSREGYGQFLSTSPFLDPESHTIWAGREDVTIELQSARGRVSGRILDENGNLYRGEATILCRDVHPLFYGVISRDSAGACTLMRASPRGTISMDGQGRFAITDLSPGPYLIAATDPVSGGYITPPTHALISDARPQVDATLRSSRAAKVTVRVRSRTGGPVPDALVAAAQAEMSSDGYTDPNGCCVLRLVQGPYTITVDGRTCCSKLVRIHVRQDAKDQTVDILTETSPQVRGTLTDESGQSVRGSIIFRNQDSVSTDDDGRFAIPIRPGINRLYGYARNVDGTRAVAFLRMAPTQEVALNIRLEVPAAFVGRILDGRGNPARNAMVPFQLGVHDGSYSLFPFMKCRKVLSDGRFQLEVPVGIPLSLDVFGDGCEVRCQSITPSPGQSHDLGDIVLQSVHTSTP